MVDFADTVAVLDFDPTDAQYTTPAVQPLTLSIDIAKEGSPALAAKDIQSTPVLYHRNDTPPCAGHRSY